jgi:hypothetical protein
MTFPSAKLDYRHLSPKNQVYQTREVCVKNGAVFVTLLMSPREMRRASSVLYLHVHQRTRTSYIGITIMPAGARLSIGYGYWHQFYFGNAIAKHGWDAFESHIVAFFDSRESANSAESSAIAAAGGHKFKYTYNLSPGGDVVSETDKPIIGLNLRTREER